MRLSSSRSISCDSHSESSILQAFREVDKEGPIGASMRLGEDRTGFKKVVVANKCLENSSQLPLLMKETRELVGRGLVEFENVYFTGGRAGHIELLQELSASTSTLQKLDSMSISHIDGTLTWNLSLSCANLTSLGLSLNYADDPNEIQFYR